MKIKLIALFFLSTSNVITGNFLGDVVPHIFFAIEPINMLYAELHSVEAAAKKYFTEVTNERMANLIHIECKKITDTNVRIVYGPLDKIQKGGQLALAYKNIIFIDQAYYAALLPLFTKEELSDNEKNTLDIFKFIIQHEAGHIKRADSKNRTIRAIISTLIKSAAFEYIRPSLTNNWQKFATFFGLQLASVAYTRHSNIAQELRADDGVCEQDTVRGGCYLCQNLINLIKDNPAAVIHDKINLSHPSLHDRLLRLQKHRDALDVENKVEPA